MPDEVFFQSAAVTGWCGTAGPAWGRPKSRPSSPLLDDVFMEDRAPCGRDRHDCVRLPKPHFQPAARHLFALALEDIILPVENVIISDDTRTPVCMAEILVEPCHNLSRFQPCKQETLKTNLLEF